MHAEDFKAVVLEEMISASAAKIAEIEEEAATEKRFLAALQQRRAALVVANAAPHSTNGVSSTLANPPPSDAESTDRIEPGRMPEHIIAALKAAGKSMNVGEIVRAVEARGAGSDAKKGIKAVVFSALGRRHDLFVRVSRGQYDLAERQGRQNNAGGG